MSRKDCQTLITDSLVNTRTKDFKGNRWGEKHCNAWRGGGAAGALAAMVVGAATYADIHFRGHESSIGNDGVLGEEWLAILQAINGLLNGEVGALDCGTVHSLLRVMAENEGLRLDK